MKNQTTTSINNSRVAIVGSGIAGLSAAIRAAVAGAKVDVYEQNSYTGGKVTAFEKDGFRFDAGPSLFTLPYLVDDLFKLAGENPRDHFNYHSHDKVCNYFWRDGTRFSMYPQLDKNIEVISSNFSTMEASRVQDYFSDAAKKYNLTSPFFLENSLHKLSTFMTLDVLKVLRAIPSLGLFSSLDEENKKYFKDPKLVQLFNRYATYNGSSPFLTPGIMQMITHLEHGLGTYLPRGGMHEISQSLTKLALKLGVEFHLGHKVEKLTSAQNKMVGVQANGIEHPCDTVFVNSDVKYAYSHLLTAELKRPTKTLKQEPSSSALIFYWGIKGSFPELDLHNIFFSDDYQKEFDAIQHNGAFWEDPTVYVNITSKLEKTDAPKGHENWFVMINVPSNQGQPWDEIIPKVKKSILHRLNQELGIDLEPLIMTEELLDPRSIERKTSSVGGALYGTSSNDRMAAFLRHPNKKSGVQGLYFCGGSAHPGGGVPLCLLSGKIATDWWLENHE